jgi:hypothetical protein
MKKNLWRAMIEVGFIIFLFYSNLLMGEFERSGMGQKRGLTWAIEDVFTATNFEIAMIAAFMGYLLFEFLRRSFSGCYFPTLTKRLTLPKDLSKDGSDSWPQE